MLRSRRCSVLLPLAVLLAGQGLGAAAPRPGAAREDPPASAATGAVAAAPEPPDPGERLYSLEAVQQDAVAIIMEYARQADQSVTMLDTFVTRISVRFKDLPFEQGLRRILLAADLDFVKDGDSYTVGLLCDLRVRYPDPKDKIIDATYRCRRISAATLVTTIQAIMGDTDLKATPGPEVLSPAVESATTGLKGNDRTVIKPLKPSDRSYRTHDVVFSGAPAFVARALSLARKFDRPRKQVRVDVRVVEISSAFERNLGVSWMSALGLQASEQPTEGLSSNAPTVAGLKVGTFNHTPLKLTATLNALETRGEARTLSNPSLVVLDGEKSFILSGQKYVYPVVTGKDKWGAPKYTTRTEKVGIYLQVGVQVGLDDDMVLTIYPQVTAVQQLQPINGGNYPIISSNEEQATIRAMEGDVIVLGGLKGDFSSTSQGSVPFLSSIPVLGRLFSSPDKVHNTDELVIFLTPEIIEEVPPPLDLILTTRLRGSEGGG